MSKKRTNADRAETAAKGVRAACKDRGDCITIDQDSLMDLLADLRHLCDRDGLDFAECDRTAQDYYVGDLEEEKENS